MTGYRHRQSGQFTLTPPQSHVDEYEMVTLSGKARVYSCTTLRAAAAPFEKDLPFQIAIVELEEGPRLTVRIEGQHIKIGDTVQQVEERNGVQVFARA